MFLFLKVIEYSALATFIGCGILALRWPDNQTFLISAAVSLAIFVFFFLISRQVFQKSANIAKQYELGKTAELYSYLLNNSSSTDSNPLAPARVKALEYCKELIDDYKRIRNQARNFYYVLQLSTVIFSGVTPILVLVDKLETGQGWLKWLPVIFPAIASIVASVATSFPFQKNWISANTTVELLEAEQEKFILGVTAPYRCYDVTDDGQQQQKARQAIENFITQVNNIHLKQLQQGKDNQPNNVTQPEQAAQSDKAAQPETEKTKGSDILAEAT